jgi:Zn-dependent protease with chaperone function
MPFVFLLVFALISFQSRWPEPPDWLGRNAGFYIGIGAPFALIALFALLTAWRTRRYCRQLKLFPSDHAWLWRSFIHSRRRQTTLLTACYLGILFGLGWGYAGQEWAAEMGVDSLAQLLLFAPYLIALIAMWALTYPAERTNHRLVQPTEPFIGRWSYVRFQARHNLLLVVPPIVLTVVAQGVRQLFPWLRDYDTVVGILGVLLLLGAIISVPLILRVFLGLRPLPAGELRDRLQAAARRLHFGFNDILLWETRSSVANAMVSGAVAWVRYIVLTDLLVEKLTPEEIEAVFGHEVGHVKHHHMSLYILFFVGSLALLTGVLALLTGVWQLCEGTIQPWLDSLLPGAFGTTMADWMASAEIAAGPILLLLVAVYVFVVFGYLSRRCERQADLYGCRAVSPEAFITALEKVADLNGIPRHRTGWLASWQHPTIAQRVAFIERLRDNPTLEPHFHRSLLKLKLGLMTGLTLGLVVVVALVAWQLGPDHVWGMFQVR